MFREGFGRVARVMNYEDQRCLGLFLKELCRHRKMLLQEKKSHTQDPLERPVPKPPQNTFSQNAAAFYYEDEDVSTSQSLLLALVESLVLSYILGFIDCGKVLGGVLTRISVGFLVCGFSSLVVIFVCVYIALSRKALDIFDLHNS